jgi:hypothetical protein
MKQWLRILMAGVLATAAITICSIVATPGAKASTQDLRVDCHVQFLDGPKAGTSETVTFDVSSGGALTVYTPAYTAPGQGSWYTTGTNTSGYTFSAGLVAIPGATLVTQGSFTTNAIPVVSSSTGSVYNSSGTLMYTTHTTTTCPYFFPGTTGCQVTYTMSQWTGNFTATLVIANTSSTAISSGGALVFSFPGTQTVTTGWNANFSQSGSTVTASNLAAIAAGNNISIGFNGAWSGSNPNPLTYSLNGVPCSVTN